ncbi:hypothetical protein [Cupriavidus pinatubonensis]|uniref:hypothetical protein n=1 Tax=Cupriavidus pinatubonensis TaxID=248026 RepID=UPI00112A1FC6|nr:hypothetical protein [Cupriavidus pinatubonensis]TPQ30826.1 hypothetical protein C2U69_30105 [Cupriavidus pinatubonensis]
MKKLFAGLASAALVGTVFAQTGVPASATHPQAEAKKDEVKGIKEESATQEKANKSSVSAQSDVKSVHASAHKEKANVQAGAHKSTATGTPHKASEPKAAHNEAGRAKVDVKNNVDQAKAGVEVGKPEAQPTTTKAANTADADKTKKQ